MSTLLIAALAAVLLVAAIVYLQQQDRIADEDAPEDARISPLLRGINYLLSDESDRALKEMVQVARLNSEAADVYMALGEMFRAKGEIGRAVRIHQNILARPDVGDAMHLQAHIALGKDFQTGGLLDRALRHYEKALMMRSDHVEALEASLRIRELSKEWEYAEELLSRLERIQGSKQHLHRAYLVAEMAADALKNGDSDDALKLAERALELDAACAHAHLVRVEVALKDENFAAAEVSIGEMERKSVEQLSLLLPILYGNEAYYRQQGREILDAIWQRQHDEELALAWLECVGLREGPGAALALAAELQFVPSTLRSSLRLTALGDDDGSPIVRQATQWRKQMKLFSCGVCGVKVVELRWQCPQCHTWGGMHPLKEENV